jgi:hypothetical protein
MHQLVTRFGAVSVSVGELAQHGMMAVCGDTMIRSAMLEDEQKSWACPMAPSVKEIGSTKLELYKLALEMTDRISPNAWRRELSGQNRTRRKCLLNQPLPARCVHTFVGAVPATIGAGPGMAPWWCRPASAVRGAAP